MYRLKSLAEESTLTILGIAPILLSAYKENTVSGHESAAKVTISPSLTPNAVKAFAALSISSNSSP